jgi:PASTA domain-containing protein
MPTLAWRNDADGYAFGNYFQFDPTERAYLDGLIQPVIAEAVALVALIAGPVAAVVVAVAAEGYMTLGPLPSYGLCGGMSYSSLDHWSAKVPLPRGAHQGDQPTRTGPASTPVRDMLWERLIHSLTSGDVLMRTLEWSLLLNQIPEPLGGRSVLLRRTLEEWEILKSHIRAGRPWPLGLVYTDRGVWDQHQVVAYGYEENTDGSGTARIYVYDCNAPHVYGQTDRHTTNCGEHPSIITLNFRGGALSGTSPSDNVQWSDDCSDRTQLDTLAGFFCSNYQPVSPPPGLATSYGRFLTWEDDPKTWMVTDGTRLAVAGADELTALGGAAGDVRSAGPLLWSGSLPPRDGALLRERGSDPVFLYAGGAPFWVPDPTWLDRFGGEGAVRTVPAGTLSALVRPPAEGALLREWSDPKIYLIRSGERRWVCTRLELAKAGGAASVRVVPDGALATIPRGQDLPPGGPTTTAPDVVEMRKGHATTAVLAADLVPAFTGQDGANAWVRSQSPDGGATVERGSTLTMQLQTGPIP